MDTEHSKIKNKFRSTTHTQFSKLSSTQSPEKSFNKTHQSFLKESKALAALYPNSSYLTKPTSSPFILPGLESMIKFSNSFKSQIPCGLDSFKLLHVIQSKDPQFTLPVLESLILNCGFDQITTVDSSLQFKLLKGSLDSVKCITFLYNCCPRPAETPVFIYKYRSGNFLEFELEDTLSKLNDSRSDQIIQRYILPRGLKVTKYRVILGNSTKVIVVSNKNRIDSKDDQFDLAEKNQSCVTQSLIEAIICQRKVSSALKHNADWGTMSKLAGSSKEKTPVFKLLDHVSTRKRPKPKAVLTNSDKFLLKKSIEENNIFIGKNQSYLSIIKMTEYLKRKIDYYYLENQKLVELACDFMQDKSGNWYFIKIKYGKTEQKEKVFRKVSEIKLNKPKLVLKTCLSLSDSFF